MTYSEVEEVRWDGKPAATLLQRMLQARLIGQRFLFDQKGELPFVDAVPRLFACLPMVGWTAKALAADAGRTKVQDKHVIAAVRSVDRAFGLVHASLLPKKQRKAFEDVFNETDLVGCASAELLGLPAE